MSGVRGEVAAVGKVNFCDRLMERFVAEKVRAALVADLIFVFFVAALSEAEKFFSSSWIFKLAFALKEISFVRMDMSVRKKSLV